MSFSEMSSDAIWADFEKPKYKRLPTVEELNLQDKINLADQWAAECASFLAMARRNGYHNSAYIEAYERYSRALDRVTELNTELTELTRKLNENDGS